MKLPFAETAVQRIMGLEAFPQPPLLHVRYPVVLMHGFGIIASFRRGGHLHEEALHLRLRGVHAYAPNVAPYNRIPIRAAMWKERIEHVLAETGAERVNLIAHSMGGLDARYLVSHLEGHRFVASLTTISTPHHGTYLAELVLKQPERFRMWVATMANWVSSTALSGATADFHPAVTELCRGHVCEDFNTAVPDHPDVRYWSYAGAAGKGTAAPINPLMQVQNRLLFRVEGMNDGFVSVESARWGTFLGTIAADHTQQVGLSLTPGGTFDSNAFYAGVVERLGREGL